MIKFVQLDPRNTEEAKTFNDAIFSDSVIGVEITDPTLAARCSLGNIDHEVLPGLNRDWAAIDTACNEPWKSYWERMPEDFNIAILRPDCDTIATASLIRMFTEEGFFTKTLSHNSWEKIGLISKIDRFAKDPIWHPGTLPTRENPWPDNGGVESSKELAPLQAMCADFKVPLKDRVDAMTNWLQGGDLGAGQWETGKYQKQVEDDRNSLIASLLADEHDPERTGFYVHHKGDIRFVTTNWDNPVQFAIISSHHRSALMIGYHFAPIVIAINDAFQPNPDQPPYRKLTICTWDGRYADIQAACRELAKLEPGWGGHQQNICGSPQGRSSELPIETIIEVVQRHLKRQYNCGSEQDVSICDVNSSHCG